MYIKRLLHGRFSKYVISAILGIGLATLFRKACNSRNCLVEVKMTSVLYSPFEFTKMHVFEVVQFRQETCKSKYASWINFTGF